jgi:PAS domain S-box-containing protein
MAAQTTTGTKPRISLTLILLVVTPVSLATIIALITLKTIGPSGPGMREFALIIGVWCAVSLGGGVVAHFIGSRHQYDPGGGLKDLARLDDNIAANGSGQSDFAVNDLTTDPEDIGVPLVKDERRIEAFLRGIGDSVTIVDLDFKIIYMNDTARKIFGDRIDESCYSVFEHKNDVCGGCPIKRSYQTEKVETSLRRVYTKEDKLLYMENSGSPIRDEADRIIGGIELARDVTQRIRLERNIEIRSRELAVANEELHLANAQLQKAYEELKTAQNALVQTEKMASLGVLVAGVAHEINNPTNFIYGSMPLLEENLHFLLKLTDTFDSMIISDQDRKKVDDIKEEMDFEYVRGDLAKIVKNVATGAKRIKEIVQNLRTFSRVDSGEKAEIDINEGIDSTLEILHHEFKNRVEMQKDYGEIPKLIGSPGKVNQVFMNVLHNAIQSISGQGKIIIRTLVENENAVVQITDNGVGIPQDKVSHIFDPFFTTKKVGDGTGLGLSISYSIIQDHHGDISVDSAEGKGTTMRIVLPLKESKAASKATGESIN